LALSAVRVDNFCSPPVQFGIERSDHPAHRGLEIGTLRVAARHLNGLLPERIGDGTIVIAKLAQDYRRRMPEAIEGQAGANLSGDL